MRDRRILIGCTGLFLPMLALVPPASGQYLPIYGGPTYDPATQTGCLGVSPSVDYFPLGVAVADGIAVCETRKYAGGTILGGFAVRWGVVGGTATVTELGTLGTASCGPTAINANGVAVGFAYKSDGVNGNRAVRWEASGAATELGVFPVNPGDQLTANALAVNAAGKAVGRLSAGRIGSGTERPVRWDAGGTAATELGNLGTEIDGTTYGGAYAINDDGTTIGFLEKYVNGNSRGHRAVRWNASDTTPIELGHIGATPGGPTVEFTDCYAYSINSAGTAVGRAYKYGAGTFLGFRPVRWDASGTAATELGNLGTGVFDWTDCSAIAINTSGTAVGSADKYVGRALRGKRAVRWNASGTAATELTNLGTDSGGTANGRAYAINAGGNVVGWAEKYVGGTLLGNRAVLWNSDAHAFDLNTLIDPASGWTLTEADGISDGNWVVGFGSFDPDGAGPLAAYTRAFLLNVSSVVPEPANLWLMTVLGLTLLRRRTRGD